MKPSSDQAAADLFTSEGAPAAHDPPVLECVTTPATMSGFHPRAMPMLQCYRKPLWRPFEKGSS